MEDWINHVLTGGGIAAGLLFGTGNAGAGVALVVAAIGAVWLIRTRDRHPSGL